MKTVINRNLATHRALLRPNPLRSSYESIGEITEAARSVMKALEIFIVQMETMVNADPDPNHEVTERQYLMGDDPNDGSWFDGEDPYYDPTKRLVRFTDFEGCPVSDDSEDNDDNDDAPPHGMTRPEIDGIVEAMRNYNLHIVHQSLTVDMLNNWGMMMLNDIDETIQTMKMLAIRVQDNINDRQ